MFFSLFSVHASFAQSSNNTTINHTFLDSVKHSSKIEIVILLLKGDDAVTHNAKYETSLHGHTLEKSEVIFDIDSPHTLSHIRSLELYQNNLIQRMKKSIPFEVRYQYQIVSNAIAIEIRGYHIPMLLSFNQIEGIYSTENLDYPHRKVAVQSTSATTAWKMLDPDKKIPYDGKDIRIGILDSGLDYYNPEFNRQPVERPGKMDLYKFEPNDKILGGYDYADKDDNPFDDPTISHGSHVAGIASGKHPTNLNFRGMAPESNLFIYKVFSSDPTITGANRANIIAAAEQSIKDKCQIINLSLGNSYPLPSVITDRNDESFPYYNALKNVFDAGIVVVASAGNNGSRHKESSNTLSSPGTFEPALQVASSTDRMVQYFEIQGTDNELIKVQATHGLHTPTFEEKHSGLEVVDCGYGRVDDFRGKNVRGKIALIARGPRDAGIPFSEKNINAREAGAIGTIVYNYSDNRDRMTPTLLSEYRDDPASFNFIPFLFINHINADSIKKIVIENKGRIVFPKFSFLTVSDYTSVGPCISADENFFKPEISAPGKQIRSTVLHYNSETKNIEPRYADFDGTSMAAPVVSGCVALIRQARPSWTPKEIKAVVMNTADLMYNHVTGEVLPYFYQGAGNINVAAAIDSPIIVQPASLVKNINNLNQAFTFSVKNVYKDNVNVTIRSEIFNLHDKINPINASLNPANLTIRPNQSSDFKISFSVNEEDFIERRYEGAIWIEIDQIDKMNLKTEKIHIPFILFENSLLPIDEPVTSLSISKDELCNERMDEAIVSFKLNTGSYAGVRGDANITNYQNYAYQLRVYATDAGGEIWGEIFQGENLPIGNYSFRWNGKDIYGNEFLPDGKFNLQVYVSGSEVIVKAGNFEVIEKPYLSQTVPVNIMGSSIPQPPIIAFSAQHNVNVDQIFKLDVVFADLRDINQIDLVFKLNTRLEILEIMPGNFVDLEKFNPARDIKETRGEITIKAFRNPELENNRASVVSLRLKARRRGTADITLSSILVKDEKGSNRKALIRIHPIEISENELIVGDFNDDGIVDELDYQMLIKAFYTNFKDESWDDRFDLNHDLIVDISDLVIFAKYYQK